MPAGVRAIKAYRPELHGDVPPVAVKRPIIKQFLVRAYACAVSRVDETTVIAARASGAQATFAYE